jgi:hypothetical protein
MIAKSPGVSFLIFLKKGIRNSQRIPIIISISPTENGAIDVILPYVSTHIGNTSAEYASEKPGINHDNAFNVIVKKIKKTSTLFFIV